MKFLLLTTLFISFSVSAQNIDLPGLKSLISSRATTVDSYFRGQTIKEVSVVKLSDTCELRDSVVKTILDLESDTAVVHTTYSTTAVGDQDCQEYEVEEASMLTFEARVTTASIIEHLDILASEITQINLSENIVIVSGKGEEAWSMTMDLSRAGMSFITKVTDAQVTTVTSELENVDIYTLDLSDIDFCAFDEDGEATCTRGDYSDVLF